MNEDLRKRILAYNKMRLSQKQAYDDFLKIIKPLLAIKKLLPNEVGEIIEKYRGIK